MKKHIKNTIICIAALSVALCASACQKDTQTGSEASAPVATVDTAKPEQPAEEPDIGEHKDYDKEDAPCYESGSIIVVEQDGKKRGMETYTMTLGTGCLEFYANELNQMKDEAGTKVKVYSMIVPTACELYCPANERYRIDSQEDIIAEVKDMLVDVTQVDVLPTLKNHNAEDIYYRSDTRWTPLGAYYAGRVFAKAAGVPYADISEYTPTAPKDYLGDLQGLSGPQAQEDLAKTPDSFSFYQPSVKYTTNYYDEEFSFLITKPFYEENEESLQDGYYDGGFYCLKLDTKVNNGRKLAIIKDEYGTVLPTFLTSSFEEIYVLSYNYLEANLAEMISEFGITDVLYLMNTYTVTDTRVYTLETLRTQATHGSLRDDAPEEPYADTDSDKKSSGSDSDATDTEKGENDVEYIYDVGINNQVGIVESSDEDAGQQYEEEQPDYGEEYDYSYEGEDYTADEEDYYD